MSTNNQIEAEIQAKGLTAPRITPQDIENTITQEFYFLASDGVFGEYYDSLPKEATKPEAIASLPVALSLLTLCVLVLKNGFTVVGKSACASPENFDAELGRKIARQDAVTQIWPLEGYRLRSELSSTTAIGVISSDNLTNQTVPIGGGTGCSSFTAREVLIGKVDGTVV